MAMTLDQLRTFQAVAAVKSFRGATEVLHITQPAISKQIQALEAELNERLFEREKCPVDISGGSPAEACGTPVADFRRCEGRNHRSQGTAGGTSFHRCGA